LELFGGIKRTSPVNAFEVANNQVLRPTQPESGEGSNCGGNEAAFFPVILKAGDE
jgi:hypothetical protein